MMSTNQEGKISNLKTIFAGMLEPYIVHNRYPTNARRLVLGCSMVWVMVLTLYIYSFEVSGFESTEERLANWLSKRDEIMAINERIPCIGTLSECEYTEDLFCQNKPKYLADYKNPCWHDERQTLHCLPYFHILGSDKAGRMDLYRRLTKHPDVCDMASVTNYWSQKKYGSFQNIPFSLRCDFGCYVRLFHHPTLSVRQALHDGIHPKIFGDGTASDFSDFRNWDRIPQNYGLEEPMVLTPHLMKHIYSVPKFIIVLRDPIEKLYSEASSKGFFSAEAFHMATVESVEMISDCLQYNSTRRCFFDREISYRIPLQVHDGCYSVYLKEWFNVFSRNHFLIIRTEDYVANVKEYVKQTFDFLHLDYTEEALKEASSTVFEMGGRTAKSLPIWTETRTILNIFYASYSQDLAHMLEDDRFLWDKKHEA